MKSLSWRHNIHSLNISLGRFSMKLFMIKPKKRNRHQERKWTYKMSPVVILPPQLVLFLFRYIHQNIYTTSGRGAIKVVVDGMIPFFLG